MPPDLNPAVAAFYAADAASDFEAASMQFEPDGEVRDERRIHRGRAAIAGWMSEARETYQHVNDITAAEMRGAVQVVTVRVSGQFPNSPITLTHAFHIAGERISLLEIS